MRTLGLNTQFFSIGLALSLLFGLFAYGIRTAPQAASLQLAEDVRFMESPSITDLGYPLCDSEVQRPRLPPPEQVTLPIYPGCEQEADYEDRVFCGFKRLFEFIESNKVEPEGSRRERVVIFATIDKVTGLMRDLEIKRGCDQRNREEAMRVIKLLQERGVRWQPGTEKGEPTNIRFGFPVSFHGAGCGE